MSTLDIGGVLERVAAHRPTTRTAGRSGFRAATALVVTRESTPRLVVIRRVDRDGDPWSGHAALPGGKHDDADRDLVGTARRETAEEVGLDLPEPIGRLDDIGGRTHMGVVSPFVFALDEAPPLHPEPSEVASAHWIPLDVLVDPVHRSRHPNRRVGPWPAWTWQTGHEPPWDELVIWGLTHRTLTNFLEIGGLA